MNNLNDLIYVTAVAKTGTLSGAARKIQVNHATVFRRIVQLEKDMGVLLFERTSGRYVATAAGEELASAGAAIETTAERSLLKVAGRDLRPSGVVRITTTDSVALKLLNPILKECRARYPEITLQIGIDNKMADLAKRDADIAVRPTLKPPDYLVGKSVGSLAFSIYGSIDYLSLAGVKPLAAHTWIALDDTQERHRSLVWLQKITALEQVAYRMHGFSSVASACEDGLGLAVLPCFVGDYSPALHRLQKPDPELASELWLLTHPDLIKAARIKAVFQVMHQELIKLKSSLQGTKTNKINSLGAFQ